MLGQRIDGPREAPVFLKVHARPITRYGIHGLVVHTANKAAETVLHRLADTEDAAHRTRGRRRLPRWPALAGSGESIRIPSSFFRAPRARPGCGQDYLEANAVIGVQVATDVVLYDIGGGGAMYLTFVGNPAILEET